ncbi:MAG: hypothetical protein GF307_09920 [candidate division Zixibacteria bacterium]|nr:hypothetical protein [candidate division Zixibacteria bacterium]
MQTGYQCGMLWGSSLAVGTESFRRYGNSGQAIVSAIEGTQHIMESFVNRTGSADCCDVTGCDFKSKFSIVKYMITGKFLSCFRLAGKWAPEAIQSARDGLSREQSGLPEKPSSCASKVIRNMGASDEEIIMVSGFAGGLGLSGNGCGALGAAVWYRTLKMAREQDKPKSLMSNPLTRKMLENFYAATGYEMLCHEITGKRFNTVDEHTEFINNGGCEKLINALAQP